MNETIFYNEMMWALILSALTFVAGLMLPEIRKRNGASVVEISDLDKVSYSKKLLLGVIFTPGLLYLPLELYIIFTDKGYSWAKEGPWWGVIFFTGLHIVAIWLFIGYGLTIFSAITGLAISFFALTIIVDKRNKKAARRRDHINEYKAESLNETAEGIYTVLKWADEDKFNEIVKENGAASVISMIKEYLVEERKTQKN